MYCVWSSTRVITCENFDLKFSIQHHWITTQIRAKMGRMSLHFWNFLDWSYPICSYGILFCTIVNGMQVINESSITIMLGIGISGWWEHVCLNKTSLYSTTYTTAIIRFRDWGFEVKVLLHKLQSWTLTVIQFPTWEICLCPIPWYQQCYINCRDCKI